VDDDELWAAFSTHAISHAGWNHEAHVRTAFLFVHRFDLDEAHLRMRAGIIRMNERHGLVETSARGYFETLTRVWLLLVADARRRSGAADSRRVLAACPELLERDLPLRYYSRARLMSVRARAVFIDPDLAPLPDAT
jgi:hypothetical protein